MKLLIGIIFLGFACSEERVELKGSLKNGTAVAQESKIDSPSPSDNSLLPALPTIDSSLPVPEGSSGNLSPTPGPDLATPPQVVNGAYLYCAELSELGSRIEIGCRMNDAQGRYVKSETLALKITYLPTVPRVEGLTLETQLLAHIDRTYDVLYFFDSARIELSRQAVLATSVKATLEDTVEGDAVLVSETQVEDVLPSAGFSVTALSGEKLINDLATGITFTRLVASLDWNEAKFNCENLNRAGSDDWVLATLPMLSSAHAHGLMLDKNAAQVLDLLSVGNLSFWSYDSADEALSTAHHMLLENAETNKAIGVEPKSNFKSVICQR